MLGSLLGIGGNIERAANSAKWVSIAVMFTIVAAAVLYFGFQYTRGIESRVTGAYAEATAQAERTERVLTTADAQRLVDRIAENEHRTADWEARIVSLERAFTRREGPAEECPRGCVLEEFVVGEDE